VAINFASHLDAARDTAALCRALAPFRGQRFVPIKANIADSADRTRLVRETASVMGRIDALVNNAGRAAGRSADLCESTEESFDELMRTNLKGPYFLTQAIANFWIESRSKPLLDGGFKVVFVTSISADAASINRGEYCVSKAGLSMASRLWALRLAREGIPVVELRPGIMETDMTAPRKADYEPKNRGRRGASPALGYAPRYGAGREGRDHRPVSVHDRRHYHGRRGAFGAAALGLPGQTTGEPHTMIETDSSLTPASLRRDLEHLFQVSEAKIFAIEKRWRSRRGSPVHTVRGRYVPRGWTDWTQGFRFGSALLQYAATGDRKVLKVGREGTLEMMGPGSPIWGCMITVSM